MSAEWMLGWLTEIVDAAQSYVELPHVELPQFSLPTDLYRISEEDIDSIAEETRRAWGLGLGPISNMVLLLENHGVIVSRFAFGSPALDAFSRWINRQHRPYVLLSDEKQSGPRSRFDAAHELGHLLLHRQVDPWFHNKAERHKFLESQAHRFAGAFLFPGVSFADEVTECSLSELIRVKRRWKLSVGMMIMRAQHLRLVDDYQAEQLWRLRSKRGWRKREPLDDEIPLEQPRLLRRVVELLLREKVFSVEALAMALPFDARDIEMLTALPPFMLDPNTQEATVTTFQPRLRRASEPTAANVVPFKREQ